MRIALFSDSWLPTIDGVAVSAMADYVRLRDQGHDVTVHVPKMKGMVKDGIPVHGWLSLPVPHYKDHAVPLVPPPSLLTKLGGYDLVYYHGATPSFAYTCLAQARLLGPKFVWRFTTFVPDYLSHAEGFMYGYAKKFLGERIARYGAKAASMIATKAWEHFLKHVPYAVVANESCAEYVSRYSKAQIKVIPPRPLPPGHVSADPMHGIPRGGRIVVLSRLSPEKNLDQAIDTFVQHIQPRRPDAHLIILGDGPARAQLEQHARGQSNIHFKGMIANEDVHSWLTHADIFLFTSLSETHGLVVEEAKRAALPVIAFDDDRGVAAQLRGTDCGRLAPPGRTDLLGQYAIDLLLNPVERQAMGLRAKADHERRSAPVQAFFPDFWL